MSPPPPLPPSLPPHVHHLKPSWPPNARQLQSLCRTANGPRLGTLGRRNFLQAAVQVYIMIDSVLRAFFINPLVQRLQHGSRPAAGINIPSQGRRHREGQRGGRMPRKHLLLCGNYFSTTALAVYTAYPIRTTEGGGERGCRNTHCTGCVTF